jgi:transcriptional regulator with XRE-family HTH domain
MISSVLEKLRDPEYRKAFVASQINVGIPFQIRALLKARGKKQDWLARTTGMLQPRISGLMTPGKTRPNIETLRRIAEAFDCGLSVRFVPFTELAEWSEKFDPETFNVLDFTTEMAPRRKDAGADAAALATLIPQVTQISGVARKATEIIKQFAGQMGGLQPALAETALAADSTVGAYSTLKGLLADRANAGNVVPARLSGSIAAATPIGAMADAVITSTSDLQNPAGITAATAALREVGFQKVISIDSARPTDRHVRRKYIARTTRSFRGNRRQMNLKRIAAHG